MDTIEIMNALTGNKFTRKIFKGVYPLDKIPTIIFKGPALIIVNTAKSTHPGEHWIALYIPKTKKTERLEFFDSFGRFLKNKYLNEFLIRHSPRKKIIYNDKPLQSVLSGTCGHYCCIYALYKAKGKSLNEFIRLFTNTARTNDEKVLKAFKRYFKSK